LKWKKIDVIVYINLAIYFFFMMFLGCFVIKHFHAGIYHNDPNDLSLRSFCGYETNGKSLYSMINESATEGDVAMIEGSKEKTNTSPVAIKKPGWIEILTLLLSIKPNDDQLQINQSDDDSAKWRREFNAHFQSNKTSYRICVIGVFLLLLHEIVQFTVSYKSYFLKTSNLLDVALIVLSFSVLLGSFQFGIEGFKRVRVLMILIMAAQTIQLIARVSFLSMSLHMAIFKKVCKTFLKTIALYLILILAFAMCFYTLIDKCGTQAAISSREERFADPLLSIVTTVRMMLADFDNMKLDKKDVFQELMFLVFVVIITVSLFNLLNALAISDTHNIIREAELVDTKKRISILNSYEKILNNMRFEFANVFPDLNRIVITPNRDNIVKIKRNLSMDEGNVVISVHKLSKTQKSAKYTAKSENIWWKGSRTVTLDHAIVNKITKHITERKLK
jgi:hypothetical protein